MITIAILFIGLSGVVITCLIIGPPRNSGDYGFDLMTPFLHLLAWFAWAVFVIAALITKEIFFT